MNTKRQRSVRTGDHCSANWEIIVDNLSKPGWSWGCVLGVDSRGRTIFVADAHRCDGQRLIVRAEEKLTAFVELEKVTRISLRNPSERRISSTDKSRSLFALDHSSHTWRVGCRGAVLCGSRGEAHIGATSG